jgi:Arc/MetJ-type ribon-helix-helix transcriptional regulator
MPYAFRGGMTVQIAIRVPEDLVSFLDEEVASGSASWRADIVCRALAEHRRRVLAERDIEILEVSRDPDLEAITRVVSHTPLDL